VTVQTFKYSSSKLNFALEKGLVHKTVITIYGALYKALDDAVRWNLVARNVSDAVSSPHLI
jgi:hypothetical protein